MSEGIWGALRNALYKSTYTLRYFTYKTFSSVDYHWTGGFTRQCRNVRMQRGQRWTWVHNCWLDPTQQQMDTTQPNQWFFELAWPNPTQTNPYSGPYSARILLTAWAIISSMNRDAQSVWQPEQHGVSEIVYQSMTYAYPSTTVYDSLPYTYRCTEILCHLQSMYVIAFVWNYS